MMAAPMLERRLEQLHMAVRVAPQSEPIQLATREIMPALSAASACLDGRLRLSALPDARDLPEIANDHTGDVDRTRAQDKEACRTKQARHS